MAARQGSVVATGSDSRQARSKAEGQKGRQRARLGVPRSSPLASAPRNDRAPRRAQQAAPPAGLAVESPIGFVISSMRSRALEALRLPPLPEHFPVLLPAPDTPPGLVPYTRGGRRRSRCGARGRWLFWRRGGAGALFWGRDGRPTGRRRAVGACRPQAWSVPRGGSLPVQENEREVAGREARWSGGSSGGTAAPAGRVPPQAE